MSDIGRRVELVEWPYDGVLKVKHRGVIISEYSRGFEVQWDGLTYPKGMRFDEISLVGSN